MIEAVSGSINSGVVLSFDVQFGGHNCPGVGCTVPDCGTIKVTDPDARAPIIKGSKAFEKGSFIKYSDPVDSENVRFYVVLKDVLNTITVSLERDLTKPKVKIYCKLPTPQDYEVSEFFLTGNFDIKKINIDPTRKTIKAEDFYSKLQETKQVTIADKLFIQVVGPALVKQESIETSHGIVTFVRSNLDNVEI